MSKRIDDIYYHVRGQSTFIDDLPEPEKTAHAVIFTSPIAHGKIKELNIKKALQAEGVIDIITYQDIPGENQLGSIVMDEPMLAEEELHVIGQPIAIILAETPLQGRKARNLIELVYEELEPVVDPRVAFEKGKIIAPPRTFALGDVDAAWDQCDVIVEGRADSAGQEHLYLETQISLAIPGERENFKIYSSTQNPSAVQKIAARVLGLPMNNVEVEILRMGGAFGGKEEQANTWACLAVMGSYKIKRPVKISLPRHEDMFMTGKRHPYSSDFKMGLKKDGTILAYEANFYQNSGNSADLSTSILERTLYHCTNSYFIPNVKATATPCYTNLTSFTAYRGFGGPQGMFVIEAAINKAAQKLRISPLAIQQKNLLKEGDEFPYGMHVENCLIRRSYEAAAQKANLETKLKEAAEFNQKNKQFKKGIYAMPVTFGISFTTIFLNQAGALVHVYNDGSINVSTGVTEMGQGVNMKIARIVADTFSVSIDRVRIEPTNTSRVANTSPTAASSGCDMNGRAAQLACLQIKERLLKSAKKQTGAGIADTVEIKAEYVYVNDKKTDLGWEKLIWNTYFSRTNLSAQAYYAVPDLYFDKTIEKGKPFAYHTFGTAVFEVTVDCLRGTYQLDSIHISHDVGKSINEKVDLGQVEGACIQGIGWLTMEELAYAENGRLLSNALSTYKIPDLKFVPEIFESEFLEDADNPHAVLKSKAVGEPPFMYGIGAYFAIINAIQAARPDKDIFYDAPITPEKVLMNLYH
ncbi:MAG: molybdopterin-dependent oxidoreductase [Spirochaetes bacterium]|nr:molybdopterin-dependent oxidoreductase [Spirochaetota bacterium]